MCVCVASLADVNWDHLLWDCGVFELSASCLRRLCFKSCFQKYPVHAWTGPETHPDMPCYQYSLKWSCTLAVFSSSLIDPYVQSRNECLINYRRLIISNTFKQKQWKRVQLSLVPAVKLNNRLLFFVIYLRHCETLRGKPSQHVLMTCVATRQCGVVVRSS